MSKRQKETHQTKVEERHRFYPLLTRDEIEARVETLTLTLGLIQEALVELGNPHAPYPEGTRAMRGAHLTITHWMLAKLSAELGHDLELVHKRADIVALRSPLVDASGKPLQEEEEP